MDTSSGSKMNSITQDKMGIQVNTIINLITAQALTSVQSSNSIVFMQITASVLFVYFFIKAYVVGTHLNCIDLSIQFK